MPEHRLVAGKQSDQIIRLQDFLAFGFGRLRDLDAVRDQTGRICTAAKFEEGNNGGADSLQGFAGELSLFPFSSFMLECLIDNFLAV